MKKKNYIVFALWALCAQATMGSTFYITPEGESSNSGNDFAHGKELTAAISKAAAGDSLILEEGTYAIAYTEGTKNTIVCSAIGTEEKRITVCCLSGMATIDFQFPELAWVQNSFGLSVTGDYWTFKGLLITHAGYQGAYVTGSYNTFVHCTFYDNRNSGLEINKGGNHTTVINCDAYRNYDPKKGGSMADGFAPKQTQGAGNNFHGCRAWNNGDDGYDCYDSPEAVTFDSCWAFSNGIDIWGYNGTDVVAFAGNGNGFKLGGNGAQANNSCSRCVSFGNPKKGFDQNNGTGGTTLYNCTGYDNGTYNYAFGGTLASGENNVFKNNVSIGGNYDYANATEDHNSWDSGFSATASDFISLDTTLAYAPRDSNGNLPHNNLFRLKEGSSLIDAGINVGLDYKGTAPDLGAFETDSINNSNIENLKSEADYYYINGMLVLKEKSGISLYNLQGSLIEQKKDINEYNCQRLAKGVYIVRISNQDNKESIKIDVR